MAVAHMVIRLILSVVIRTAGANQTVLFGQRFQIPSIHRSVFRVVSLYPLQTILCESPNHFLQFRMVQETIPHRVGQHRNSAGIPNQLYALLRRRLFPVDVAGFSRIQETVKSIPDGFGIPVPNQPPGNMGPAHRLVFPRAQFLFRD